MLELTISIGVALVGLAAVVAFVSAAGQVAGNTELLAASNDASRSALDQVVGSLRNAGVGTPGGLLITTSGGVPQRINAVWGVDGTTGEGDSALRSMPHGASQADEVWVVVPHRAVNRRGCSAAGAAVTVTAPGEGPLAVSCTQGVSSGLLLASDGTTGALLSVTGVTAAAPGGTGVIDFAERSLPGYSTAPERGGFQVGDQVFPVRVLHFFVQKSASGRPALFVAEARPGGPPNRPFIDAAAAPVQLDVEDLQVVYGLDVNGSQDPSQYEWRHGLSPQFLPSLRSVRITVVGRSERPQRSADGKPLSTNAPLKLENEAPVPPIGEPDGLRRSISVRRLELLNLAPGAI